MMAPTEASILSNFLLSPAPLTTIISLQQFAELFPRHHRSNPRVKLLYRELQHLRALDLDEVRASISREVKRGEKQKAELRRARRPREDALLESDDLREADIDTHLFGATSNRSQTRAHSLSSLLPDMDRACEDLESEIATLDAEVTRVSDDLETTIGDLSDLRYGKFGQAPGSNGVAEEVVNGLRRLEEACKNLKES
jgi:centromere-localized protein 2